METPHLIALGLVVLLLLVRFPPAVWCYSSGQVTASCDSMAPNHGVRAQTGPAPYSVTLNSSSFSLGEQVTVLLQATSTDSFKGFLLKATEVGSQAAVGSFTGPSNAQLLSCSQKPNSAVSHTSSSTKTSVQATWIPDAPGSGKSIQFFATFVQSKSVFWVAVKSSVLTCTGNGTGGLTGSTQTETPAIVKAHGSLMLISWMTTGTLGMLVARYMKGMSRGNKMFGKDMWFVCHVPVMCVTVAATFIAFIIIFVYGQGWSGGAHPVLGCLTMILSFIQPIIALMRCGPQDARRYVFNWTHSLNALVIKLLAVAAIFTGLQLIDGSDSQWMVKTMSGFAAWECLFYVFMEARFRWKTHNPDVMVTKTTLQLLSFLLLQETAVATNRSMSQRRIHTPVDSAHSSTYLSVCPFFLPSVIYIYDSTLNSIISHNICVLQPELVNRLETPHFTAMELLVLLLLCFSPVVWCYSTGLVTASCDSMVPQHGVPAQTTPAPYTVTVDRTILNLGDQVTVRLQATGSNAFEGFLLKAMQAGSQTAVGSFSVSTTGAQLLACSQKPNSAVSHTSALNKSQIQATWTPDSSGSMESIKFLATFVQSESVFWVAVQSPVLNYISTRANVSAGNATTSTSTTTQTPSIVKAHGSLMLISWMTTGPLGMIIARYLKGMSKGYKMCGKDIWFVVHVPLMCLTVAATIIAFIIIFVFAQDWAGGAHPVLGCLVMILSFIQPIIAFMRCEPQDAKRYVFNWVHSINALVIKILAVAAIFIGLSLLDSSDNQWLVMTMSGFVAWECLFYICMEAHFRWKIHTNMLASGTTSVDSLLVAVFFLGNIAFLIALLYGIGTATVVP
ncbi:putative ferric-chelate reductase 1 [Betta splendens]|uniref:Ferric-chelate reductase 1 n=1 Tax=Betta splendens TaxID=158456 RepID=A0A9W2XRZ6_BETSP|nr:putative ferric-chelate reductase 1 [Betta splendens]